MTTRITLSKENSGSDGTGFNREGGSNSISNLPRSSMRDLGVDPVTVTGTAASLGEAGMAVTTNSKAYGGNVGQGQNYGGSGNSKLGLDENDAYSGTQGSRENAGVFGSKGRSDGQFAKSALRGPGPEGNPRVGTGFYGSNARSQGTESSGRAVVKSESNPPTGMGSMQLARLGLNASGTGPISAGRGKANAEESATRRGLGKGGNDARNT